MITNFNFKKYGNKGNANILNYLLLKKSLINLPITK